MMPKITPDTPILYLDYDGCLHPGLVYRTAKRGIHLRGYPGHTLFEWAPILVRLLAPWPDVKIILSTTWVRAVGFSESKERLPRELQRPVAGATWHSEMIRRVEEWEASARFQQIIAHVQRHELTNWIAIDDDDMGWPDILRDRLVKCSEHLRLREPEVQADLAKKLEMLNQKQ